MQENYAFDGIFLFISKAVSYLSESLMQFDVGKSTRVLLHEN